MTDTFNILHMPAFFVMYGMAVQDASAKKGGWFSFIKRRIRSLLVPYALWALIYSARRDGVFFKNLLFGNNQALGRAETNMVLWFLPCMFVATLLYDAYLNGKMRLKKREYRLGYELGALLLCAAVSLNFVGFRVGGRVFGWDIAFCGCLCMILGGNLAQWVEKARSLPAWGKALIAVVGFITTGVIAQINVDYTLWSGARGVTMAWGVYGRLDLFVVAALIGTVAVLMIGMLFERNTLLAWMGRFSLVIMAVHYILFIFVSPQCNKVLQWDFGKCLQPSLVAISVFLMCIPICWLIDWACPELNGKAVRSREQRGQKQQALKLTALDCAKILFGVAVFAMMFFSTSLISYVYLYV